MLTKPVLAGALCALVATAANAAPDVTQTAPAAPKPVTVRIKKAAPQKTMVLVRSRKRADLARPMGVKAVVIDEPNLETGTVSVVTEKNEFATISTGMGTRFARGNDMASLGNIHVGYTLRCFGAWDQDGFQYQATRITLGNSVSDTTVVARVNAACENISRARKGGGFGQAMVAIASQNGVPKAVGIGTGTLPAQPVPADLIPGQTPAPASQPAPPQSVPVAPQMIPVVPGYPQTVPGTPVTPAPTNPVPTPVPSAPVPVPAPVSVPVLPGPLPVLP